MTGRDGRGQLLRRYPSLAFVALAVALAATLPSTLNLPTSGPPELAEFAPVPPDEQDTPPQQGDLSALGEAGSAGLGAGAGTGAGGAPPPPPPPPPPPSGPGTGPEQVNPQHKRCVGDPPRQTEDPLSPPCVSYFDGDNGGATARGVTGDEVVVVALYESNDATGEWVELSASATADDADDVRRLRVYSHYFNDRYQTWGRTVRVFGYGVQNGMTAEEARAHAVAVDDGPPGVGAPFGVFVATSDQVDGLRGLLSDTARRGMLSVSYDGDDRSDHLASAPLYLSLFPDLQDVAAITGSYVCARLAGLPPSHAGPATAGSTQRRLALYYSDDPEDPEYRRLKNLFVGELQARGCADVVVGEWAVTDNSQHSANVAAMRSAGATTVVLFLRSNYRGQFAQVVAAQPAWEPEIFVPGIPGFSDSSRATNLNQATWRRAFGLILDRRRDAESRQPQSVAFRDACPSCPYRSGIIPIRQYESMALLFRAIQAAGPELTPQRAEQGLRSIPPNPSPSPYAPAAYFTPDNYSFFKDAMEVWWDPTGSPPGRDTPDGCYRLVRDGTRARAGEWPAGDDGLFDRNADQPCQGWQNPGTGR